MNNKKKALVIDNPNRSDDLVKNYLDKIPLPNSKQEKA